MRDYCVIGGGIVGLATAMRLLERRPGSSLVLLEKERDVACHQSGHNSGVIHSGIYYTPGSLKAELCRAGARATVEFCAEHDVEYELCGKLIVATNDLELARMTKLFERAKANRIDCEKLDAAELGRWEPNIVGCGALYIPSTGIVDYPAMCRKMADRVQALGGEIEFETPVTGIDECETHVAVRSGDRERKSKQLIACAGIQADRVARLAGIDADFQMIPFRGEYYRLPEELSGIVQRLIYPVPAPELPFLGVHLTRMIDGGVTVGPNAVLGFAREEYAKFSFNMRDVATFLSFPGFWRVIGANVRSGLDEMRNSIFKRHYLQACRKYCPSLRLGDLLPETAGIRAQAVMRDGTIVHDFLIRQTGRTIHVCNAPSPAATSALPIANAIAGKVAEQAAALK